MAAMGSKRRPCWLVSLRWCLSTVVATLVAIVAVVVGCKERSALRVGRNIEVPESFLGKTVVVTGATSGIGFGTAIYLLKMGAHVIVHGPNEERTRKAAREAHEFAGGRGKATPMAASLDDFAAVRRMAKQLSDMVPQVHVILLNAGFNYGAAPVFGAWAKKKMLAMKDSEYIGKNGGDRVLSINHYGHFLLTMLLRPKWASDVKIVSVTGNGMWQGDWRRLVYPGRFPWQRAKEHSFLAYEDSKLANLCFAHGIQKYLGPQQYAVVYDPGQIRTTMTVDRKSKYYTEKTYMHTKDTKWIWWHMSIEQAAERLVRAAYVTRRPVPDLVSAYWMPKEIWRHRNHMSYVIQRDYWRQRYPVKFLMNQVWTFGPLYDIVGPMCGDETFVQYFWNHTLNATGFHQYVDQAAFKAYYKKNLASVVETQPWVPRPGKP